MVPEPKKALEVFFSYSHKDQELRDQLETHLSLLQKQGVVSSWHDRKIIAGAEWAREIDEHLNTAQIILLLISADFIASNYCYDIEVKRAMERHSAGEACVIPVILRSCDWQGAPFGRLQALPTDGKPVDSRNWYNKDEAFHDITQGIRKAVKDLQVLKNQQVVQKANSEAPLTTNQKITLPKLKVDKAFNPYAVRDEWIEYITLNLKEAIEEEGSLDFYANDAQGHRQIRILFRQKTIYALDVYKDSMGGSRGDDGVSFSCAEGRVTPGHGFNASGNFKWDKQKEAVVLDLLDMSLISSSTGITQKYTKEEFLNALWNKILLVIERSVL